jgi:adenylyltransferase/sulfurtransferase
VPLSPNRAERYGALIAVPGFGELAQERLQNARVRVVGADAVASPALVALAQAGVGRLWLDDPEDVNPSDRAGWLFPPSAVGSPRGEVAREALSALSDYIQVDAYPVGGVPSAALIIAPSLAQSLAAAEVARRAAIPHVVVETDGDGGALVTVPIGAPCYACGRSSAGVGRPPEPGIAALAALAALELIQLIATPGQVAGRRIDLVRGVPTARPTVRLAGCACNAAVPPVGGD